MGLNYLGIIALFTVTIITLAVKTLNQYSLVDVRFKRVEILL